jgi:hypothetical protein
VNDEFIRVIPFREVTSGRFDPERAYTVRAGADLIEPDSTYRGTADPWVPGSTVPAGQTLTMQSVRFKKISQVVRVDPRMVPEILNVMIRFARIGVVRAFSEALLGSSPPDADDTGSDVSGLPKAIPATQNYTFDSTQNITTNLAQLLSLVHPSDGDYGTRADAIVGSDKFFQNLDLEWWNKGLQLEWKYCHLTGRNQRHLWGIPLLVGRVPEPAAATPTATVFAVKLLGPSGISVACRGGDPSNYCVQTGPRTTMVGLNAAGDANTSTEGVEVWMEAALIYPEDQSAAMGSGFPN